MGLPLDDNILLSLVNTFLRDGGELQDFCGRYGGETEEVVSRLGALGYTYCESANAFTARRGFYGKRRRKIFALRAR